MNFSSSLRRGYIFISIYSSMDRVLGFDPNGVGSNPTKCCTNNALINYCE